MSKELTSRQRVLLAIEHKEPDRVPIDMGSAITTIMIGAPYGYKALCEYMGIEDYPEPEVWLFSNTVGNVDERILQRFGVDLRSVQAGAPPPEFLLNGDIRVEWGLILTPEGPVNSIMNEKAPLRHAETIQEIEDYPYWPAPTDPVIAAGKAEQAKSYREQGYAVMGVSGLAMVNSHMYAWLRGFDVWLTDMRWNKRFAHALYEKISDIAVEYTRTFLEAVGPYIDILYMSDDEASQDNLFISLDDYREFIKPWHRRWIEEAKKVAPHVKIFYHCCGAMLPLIPDLLDIGIDILNPIQPKSRGMEPERLKREFGDRLAFHGGIDVQELLPFGSPQDIRQEVKRYTETLAPGGGYILAPSHELTQDIPPENIVALYEAALEYGYYKT